jgi:hypothetical protein
MTHYIETKTKDGIPFRIEVEDTSKPTPGFTRTSTPTNVSSEAAAEAFAQLLQAVQGVASDLINTVQTLESAPSVTAVDFAIKIDPEVGALVARSRDDAQFRVSLTWKETGSDTDKAD